MQPAALAGLFFPARERHTAAQPILPPRAAQTGCPGNQTNPFCSSFLALALNRDRGEMSTEGCLANNLIRSPGAEPGPGRAVAPHLQTHTMIPKRIGGNSLPSLAGNTPADRHGEPAAAPPAPMARTAGQQLAELNTPRTPRQPPAMDVLKRRRKPETRQRLHRLRKALGEISPAPSSPEQAWADIRNAMARADLAGWTLPALSDEAAIRHADGSVEIGLISHAIVFNPGGAFRILDLLSPGSPYFEMAGHGGIAFVAPR
ncbi:hypothetical protein [Ralstonia solanacearum]